MSKLSISFTLGKASTGNANIEHNNREFISNNVDVSRIVDNIIYVREDIHDVYDELFGEALQEYNDKQTRKDRKIYDYFQHIENDKRRETHYEILVQFGDSNNAGVGSENGQLATKMLDEYIRQFQERNPNLRVVNSCLHLDESSPHAHIDFVPFYNQNKEKGLTKGVSLRAALEEQGFANQNKKLNGMVAWENSEKQVLENILNDYGIERDIKNANHIHKSVPQYKESQDWKKLPRRKKNLSTLEVYHEHLQQSQAENALLKVENEKLIEQQKSPWKSFYFSDTEKQSFVQAKLDELNIPIRETENGFDAQQCYIEKIRMIEKQYVSAPKSHRETLQNHLDRIIMQSNSFDEVLQRLQDEDYIIKRGKYVAVQPSNYDGGFIRLKSLGEDYSEQSIKNRITNKRIFESGIDNKINAIENPDSIETIMLKTIRQYTIIFKKNLLPVRKIHPNKPFTWTNCEELDRLASLNKRINQGITIESLRNDLAKSENAISQDVKYIDELKVDLDFNKNLYDTAVRWYSGKNRNYDDLEVLEKYKLTMNDYGRLKDVIADKESQISDIEQSISDERAKQKDTSDTLTLMEKVIAGTHVQSLINEEKQRRQTKIIGNGVKSADGRDSERIEEIGLKIVEMKEQKYFTLKPPKR